MVVSLKHTTQAVGTDAGNGEIGKTEWNEEHTLTLATGKLLGRSTAGTGAAEEITVGSGLTLNAGTLTAAGTVGGSDTQLQFNDGGSFAGDSGLTFNKTTNALTIGAGTLNFTGSSSGTVTIQPAAAAGTYTLTLPTTDGDSGQALVTDGNGVLSWAAAGGGTPGGSNTQLQYNNAGAFAGASGLTTNGTELTIASGTKTTSAPVLDATQTWNNAAVTFTGMKMNVTDTASAAASLLMDLQVGGSGRFTVNKLGLFSAASSFALNTTYGAVLWNLAQLGWGSSGTVNTATSPDTILTRRGAANIRLGAADAAAPVAQTLSVQSVVAGTTNTAGANLTITGSQGTGTGAGGSIIFQVAPAGSSGTAQNALADALTIASTRVATFASTLFANGTITTIGGAINLNASTTTNTRAQLSTAGLYLQANGILSWAFSSSPAAGNDQDLVLARDAADTLAQRRGVNAQSFRVYSTFTDASNYERGALNAGADFIELAAETAGTGDDNLDVRLTPAGTGNVRFGTHTATSDTAISGYIEIKDAGGTIRKLAVIS